MGNRRISSDLKELALDLWSTGWDTTDICYIFRVSRSSLYRWQKLFEEFGAVTRPPSPIRGRPRIICMTVLNFLFELYRRNPDTLLDECQWYLAIHHDIAISISALQETLERAGLTRKILHKLAAEADLQKEREFLSGPSGVRNPNHFSGTGTEFVAVDESSKDGRELSRRYGRSPSGESAEKIELFIRGVRYSLIAALTVDGYIATRAIPGAFDSPDFFDFIVDDVVSVSTLFPVRY